MKPNTNDQTRGNQKGFLRTSLESRMEELVRVCRSASFRKRSYSKPLSLRSWLSKKILFCSILLVFSQVVFSQQLSPSPTFSRSDYLKKSADLKLAAWITLSAGVSLVAIAGAFYQPDNTYIFGYGHGGNASVSSVLIVFGLASTLASIPLFIIAAKNKRKAFAVSYHLKMESVKEIQQMSFTTHSFPAFAIKINLANRCDH